MLWDDRNRRVPRLACCDPSMRIPGTKFPGGHRRRVTPVPIPNTEVKPSTADGTARAGGWESRSLPGIKSKPAKSERIWWAFSFSVRNMRYLKALVLFAVTIAAGCAATPTAPSTSSSAYIAAQLEGTWNLASIEPAGAGKQNRPSAAVYTLTFGTSSRLSTRADCNTCARTYSVDETSITAGPNLACTRAACPTMAFESAYTTLLGGVSQAVVTNSTLTLSSSRGTISLVRD